MIVGTRASKLARIQTNLVVGKLSEILPEEHFEIVTVSTGGDRNRSVPIAEVGGRGVFVKELEEALLNEQVDFVVHSLKDVPVDVPEGLLMASTLCRIDPQDVLVSVSSKALADLPAGGRVATSSRRRIAQLRALRDDLEFVDIRGNVPTRLKKMEEGHCDAIVLAAAGLIRLGLGDRISERFDSERCTPAAGQGALALECRAADERTIAVLGKLEDPIARAETACERAYLARLGGGCSVPIGASARAVDDSMVITGCIASLDGQSLFRQSLEGALSDPEQLGRELAISMQTGDARRVLVELSNTLPGEISPP